MSISTGTLSDDYSLDLNLFHWNNICIPSFLNIYHQSGSLAWYATSLLILNSLFSTFTVEYPAKSSTPPASGILHMMYPTISRAVLAVTL